MWASIIAGLGKVFHALTGGRVQQGNATIGGAINQSPNISGQNIRVNFGPPEKEVPDQWWDRPGAPEFGWSGSMTAGEKPKLDPRVRQTGGQEIGQVRLSMFGRHCA
jgi:hypothetical protein